MQVSHVQDHVTHAVIGGDANIEFGISNSAEFFNILSSTLYTDQKLAVVREVLCNAWDAHVDAGITDRAVIVTINADKFTVQDFGYGIPKDKIGPIYGTYGNSTKQHDGKQTGGFGLGCKAPFAYTDHFEVTSINGGEKTIYAMSRSSAQVGGKPGIKPIATFPASTESGITVSLDLKESNDRHLFHRLVERIARNGEMNVMLNGKQVETIPFSTMKHDFLITKTVVYDNHVSRIYVRYGNVIYPVDRHPDFHANYEKICSFLARLRNDTYRIVFQAPPHSISVTPSRESLSMQEHTVRTLTQIFDAFVKRMEGELEASSFNVMRESIAQAVVKGKTGMIFSPKEEIPFARQNAAHISDYMTEISRAASWLCSIQYPKYDGFRKADILQRIQTLIDHKLGPLGLLQSFRDAYKKECRSTGDDPDSWFHRRLVAPLLKKLPELLSADRLYVYGHGVALKYDYSFKRQVESVARVTDAARLPMEHYLPYLRNLVVLSYSRIDVEKRVGRFPEIQEKEGSALGYLIYTVPRVQKRVEAAREFFTAQGMTVLDLTIAHPWESQSIVVPEVRAPATPKKEGYVCFSATEKDGKFVTLERCLAPDAPRITTPEWFARLPRKDRDGRRDNKLSGLVTGFYVGRVISLFGSKGAMVTTAIQEEKLAKTGALDVDTYLIRKVCAYLQTSPTIAEWLQFATFRVCRRDTAGQNIYRMAMRAEVLRKQFGLVKNLTAEDRTYWSLWERIESVANSYGGRQAIEKHPEYEQTVQFIKAQPISPIAAQFHDSMANNGLLELLDVNRIQEVMKQDPIKHAAQIERTKEILLLALKG
jgi:hypothetical protein